MVYKRLEDALIDLEKNHMLVRIPDEVDPFLEMAAIHLRVHEKGGPALLFERVKGSRYRACSNLFGTTERCRFLFRHRIEKVQQLIAFKQNPVQAIRHPFKQLPLLPSFLHALPSKQAQSSLAEFDEIQIQDLPLITHWKNDGGAFVTLPQVYSEDIESPGIMQSNLGMYRIQLNGNQYVPNKEVGLHYQLHRGIGIHQQKAQKARQPLRVSCFVGGPPAHTVAAVMPLPEGLSELTFAGVLGGRRFQYTYHDGFCISTDADFILCGTVEPGYNKPEGPFGDHLGYYSLQHEFPVLKIHKVLARKNAIWPFTVVGRPPQEDTGFGNLIHELSGEAIRHEIPGVREVHAVDAAGVHPLLFAIGSERYTPYATIKQPAELLTQANRILGSGQLSLAKYLFITNDESNSLSTRNIPAFLHHILTRIQWQRDLHFYTQTSIDTLDYSGPGLNTGSKLVLAATGPAIRELNNEVPASWTNWSDIRKMCCPLPGILCIETNDFISVQDTEERCKRWTAQNLHTNESWKGFPLWVLCNDADFLSASLSNFLWVTFTRSNPAHDVHGMDSFTENKHWGCHGPLIIDARSKPHHAPVLEKDTETENKISRFFQKGGILEKYA